MESVIRDVRYGVRMLARNPGFTAVAAITLALGISLTTVMFTFVNAVILRPLPYADSNRIVMASGERRGAVAHPVQTFTQSGFAEWRAGSTSFEHLGAFTNGSVSMTGAGEPERIFATRVTGSFFETFGVAPVAGRTLTAADARPGADAIVIGSSLWERRFQSSPSVIGRAVVLDGRPFTIVGVMPSWFSFPRDLMYLRLRIEIWMPLEPEPSNGNAFLQAAGLLKPDRAIADAQAEMNVIAQRLEAAAGRKGNAWQLVPLQEQLVAGVRPLLLVFAGAVAFVLLIACTNVANLLLARAATRQKEIAVRRALGSGRARLVRQLLTESILLGLLGGAAGLLLALWGAGFVRAIMPPSALPRLEETAVDPQVLAFTLALSFATSILFGLGPAMRSAAADVTTALKEAATSQTTGLRLLNSLVVAEVALAFVLLTGAGLLIRSFARLTSVDPGFRSESILTLSVSLPDRPYEKSDQLRAFAAAALDRVKSVPGVAQAGAINWLPLGGDLIQGTFLAEGIDPMPRGLVVAKPAVSADYFAAMGIPILRGRAFDRRDGTDAPGVAIVTEQVARQLWPQEDAIGKRLKIGFGRPEEQPWLTVVGIAGDVKQTGLGDRARPAVYMPIDQAPRDFLLRNLTFVARTDTPPAAVAAAMRREIRAVDPNLPFDRVITMQDLLDDSVSEPRFRSIALGGFAAIALALVASGVLGVLAYSVSRRTREIGVRMALGAQQLDVVRLVVRQAAVLTVAGLALGAAGAIPLSKVLERFLFGVEPGDPGTLAAVSILLLGVALLASYVPARRASSVDPLIALRPE
jgi:putative ABC transport system permease protein